MKIKIRGKEIQKLLDAPEPEFPKYTTQLLNIANKNAQGTRPKVVGQLSDLIQEFSGKNMEEWKTWYLDKHPEAIKNASSKVSDMINLFRDAINKIDNDLIEKWVTDLVIVKTFVGLRFQEAILKKVANAKNASYRLSTADEESKGIDGYVGRVAVSIKPITYKVKPELDEKINAEFIFYKKVKNDLEIEFNF